jgi:hypothetical protein
MCARENMNDATYLAHDTKFAEVGGEVLQPHGGCRCRIPELRSRIYRRSRVHVTKNVVSMQTSSVVGNVIDMIVANRNIVSERYARPE